MKILKKLPATCLLMISAMAVLLAATVVQGRMPMNVVPQVGSAPVYTPGATAESMKLTSAQWTGIREYVDAMCQRLRWQRHHEALCVRVMWKQNAILAADTAPAPVYHQPTPVTQWNTGTMGGTHFMIKAPDYAQLPAMYGHWSVMLCGTAAAYLTSPYPIQDGPCEPGQVRTYGDYFSLVTGIRAGTSGSLVVFDPEWTTATEAANEATYIRLGCQVAARHHVRVIVTPAGRYTTTLWNELAAGARYCNLVEIQSQGVQGSPATFKQKVSKFLGIVRSIPHHATPMVGLATDPGGKIASVSALITDYHWLIKAGVSWIWMNLCPWSPPKGDGTGDPQIAEAFLQQIGAAP